MLDIYSNFLLLFNYFLHQNCFKMLERPFLVYTTKKNKALLDVKSGNGDTGIYVKNIYKGSPISKWY